MTEFAALYEVSWEVCHKVGGIHTVVATKARSMVERHGDGYLAVGPWLLSEGNAEKVLDAEPAFDAFAEGCRAAGVPVRVGRWCIPGRPRVVLVEFSGLYARKDQILEAAWKEHRVSRQQILSINERIAAGSPALWSHVRELIEDAARRGFIEG